MYLRILEDRADIFMEKLEEGKLTEQWKDR